MPLYMVRFKIFGIPTNTLDLMMSLSIVIWAFFGNKKHFSKILVENKFVFLAISTLILGVITALFGENYSLTGLGILKSWFILPIGFSFVLINELNSRKDVPLIILSIFLSTLLVSFFAIVYKFLGIVTFDNRLSAFYESPNYLAMFIAPGILCGTYLTRISQKKIASVFLAGLLLETVVLFLTTSYATWLGIFFALLIYKLIFPNKQKWGLNFIFIIILGFLILFSQLNSEKMLSLLTNNPRSSLSSRIMIWKSAVMMIEKKPIFGIGPGKFQSTYLSFQQYFPPYLEWAVPQPHNIFLAFWLESSIMGLASFIAILFLSIIISFKHKKTECLFSAFLLSFFVYTIFSGLFDTPYWKNDLSLIFWIFVMLTTINLSKEGACLK